MSKDSDIAIIFIRMLADWYQEYADSDRKRAKSGNSFAAINASAWDAAANKARELAQFLEDEEFAK